MGLHLVKAHTTTVNHVIVNEYAQAYQHTLTIVNADTVILAIAPSSEKCPPTH